MTSVAFGSQVVGSVLGALTSAFFDHGIPSMASKSAREELEDGDKYRVEAQTIMMEFFDKFDTATKIIIKTQYRMCVSSVLLRSRGAT